MYLHLFSKSSPSCVTVALGGKDKAADRGGEDAGVSGGALAANHDSRTGDHTQGERAGGQSQETSRGRTIPAGETGGSRTVRRMLLQRTQLPVCFKHHITWRLFSTNIHQLFLS